MYNKPRTFTLDRRNTSNNFIIVEIKTNIPQQFVLAPDLIQVPFVRLKINGTFIPPRIYKQLLPNLSWNIYFLCRQNDRPIIYHIN